MPITQERMIALVTEAESILRERDELRREITLRLTQVDDRMISEALALTMIGSWLSLNPPLVPVAIRLEARHFALNQKKNIRRAEYEKARRRGKGMLTSSTAPSTLLRELSLEDLGESEAEAYLRFQREGES